MEEALEIEMPGENQTFPVEDVLQHFSCEKCSKEAWYGTSQLAVANPEILKGGADFFFPLFFLSFFLIFSSPK